MSSVSQSTPPVCVSYFDNASRDLFSVSLDLTKRQIDVATVCSYNVSVITWDESKRRLNLKKHGIDFREADEIFDGPTVTAEDARSAYGEQRLVTLGVLSGVVVSMTYTERNGDMRIISIRKALKHETRSYLSQISK